MNKFEDTLFQTVKHNSLLFLEDGVKRIIDYGGKELYDIIVLSCPSIQISLELAMKAFVLREKGVRFLVKRNKKGVEYTDEEIEKIYNEKRLLVKGFDDIKKQINRMGNTKLRKEDYEIIEDFQNYRNKLVHFCCPLAKEELSSFRENLMYYVVHVVLCLLYDNYKNLKPAEYFEELLGYDFFRILWNDYGYIRAIEQLAKEQSKEVGVCPICERNAYSLDEEFCYFCNTYPNDGEWGRTHCLACDGKKTVVYDRLNIHYPKNHHSMPGFCQHCEAHPQIFECPICGQTHWLYSDTYDWMCYDGHCTTENKDYPVDNS